MDSVVDPVDSTIKLARSVDAPAAASETHIPPPSPPPILQEDPLPPAAPLPPPSPPLVIPKTDRYGFIIKNPSASPLNSAVRGGEVTESIEERQRLAAKENARMLKWRAMIESSSNPHRVARSRLFHRRVLKGIPDSLRAFVWTKMLAVSPEASLLAAPAMLTSAEGKLSETALGREALDTIQKDLGRTYPLHVQFISLEGQAALGRVLSAYAVSDPEIGYCQGMSFFTAMFLMYTSESEALCLLQQIMQKPPWMMRDMSKPGMHAVELRLYQYEVLLARAAPKVSKHFRKFQFVPSMYAVHWFTTVFTYNFPFCLVLRIWDCFLLQGWPIVMGASVAFWRLHQNEICKIQAFEQFFEQLKKILNTFSPSRMDEFMFDASYLARTYCTEDKLRFIELEFLRNKQPKQDPLGARKQ